MECVVIIVAEGNGVKTKELRNVRTNKGINEGINYDCEDEH